MLFLDAVEAFINFLNIELQRSPYTINGYQKDLKYLHDYLQKSLGREVILSDFNIFTIRKYLFYAKKEKKYAPRTMMRNIATFKSFGKFLFYEGLCHENIADRLRAPKIPQEMPRYLNKEEIHSIFASVDPNTDTGLRDYTILMTLYYTGLRVSELTNLTVKDVSGSFDLSVRQGKGGKCRVIPIHQELQRVMDVYLRHRLSTSRYLFPNKNGVPLSTQYIRLMVKKYAALAGIDPARVSPHVFRHSFATMLYKNGQVDLLRISKLLGHANLRATTIYTHTSADHLREAIERL